MSTISIISSRWEAKKKKKEETENVQKAERRHAEAQYWQVLKEKNTLFRHEADRRNKLRWVIVGDRHYIGK